MSASKNTELLAQRSHKFSSRPPAALDVIGGRAFRGFIDLQELTLFECMESLLVH